MGKGWVVAAGMGLGLLAPARVQAQAPSPAVRFITVDQGKEELAADRALAEALDELVASPDQQEYKAVIFDLVADSKPDGTVARVTPYAFVVAEMLGAKMDLIATFRSRATGTTTYGAYLVVRRSDFPSRATAPTVEEVMDYLRQRSDKGLPAKFVYHDKLSTSSYFVPSLYFRGQRVFARSRETDDGISTIDVEQLQNCPTRCSSADVVTAVAEKRADVASVWDGARSKFDKPADAAHALTAGQVWFVRLQENLPNDLLVATRNGRAVAGKIRDKLKLAGKDEKGTDRAGSDVQGWVLWSSNVAENARMALSELRRQASASTQPVVVEVRAAAVTLADEVEAVCQAVRLSGTELVVKSEYSDYARSDISWELARIHDDALRMTIRYDHFFDEDNKEVKQQFDVKFTSLPDLTRRVSLLINARMHRIRPVWLYWDAAPTVIRDVAFDSSEHARLPFQEILWKNPRRNDYGFKATGRKVTELEKADDLNKLTLSRDEFPVRGDRTLDFEPMGRTGFRVLLLRPSRERRLFQALTAVFVGLMIFAALALAWDARRYWPLTSTETDASQGEAAAASFAHVADHHTTAATGRA